jgi:hypothetical protein
MRSARLVSVLLALALSALLPFVTAPAASSAEDKPRHLGFATGKEIGNTNKFVAYGKWGTYKGRTIKVQRRACGSCPWKFYKETKTSEDVGWFRTRIAPGRPGSRVCYRVVVPSTAQYRITRDVAGCITTER